MSSTSSYRIALVEDILRVGFNKEMATTGDRIVRDAIAQLNVLIDAGQLHGGQLIKINGKMSLIVSYTLAHSLMHLYGAIAVFDPRLKAYIVVKSETPDYPIASRIDAETGEITLVESHLEPSGPSSFLLNWDGDILKAQLNGQVTAEGDRIVRDTYQQLQTLMETGQLPGGQKPLLINGRASVLASFAIASRLAHLYSSVAVFDPKVGEGGLNQYVVAIAHGKHRPGEILCGTSEAFGQQQSTTTSQTHSCPTSRVKVVICGFPNTGKTNLHNGLKKLLYQSPDVPDAYVISGCPDGEGSWFSETVCHDAQLARQLKDEYKSKFTPEFAQAKARDIKVISNSLLVFDVGGKISSENRTIMSEATHAIILAKSDADVEAWQAFCWELNLPVVAIVQSDYHGTSDRLESEFPLLKGSIHRLDRTEDVSSRPMVQKLVRVLVNLVLKTKVPTNIEMREN
ncbi:CRISPR-associated protein Csx3 [Roseofilum sp. BLCC_M154]|uniref:CRISPR-associated protein Csx3 n=1 Tax=Roseofilum acuticapitatum BLCC-M154 TaxID=3022444 RepID=A0ABT7ASB1_9CYAN|nr:CRISPR-associated protein Csx3 [Roseofilum acuticapitatum]MDJ1168938.1 CRISPR-associated protein Csx3 [Roseofilum acuticapitatum BLCC-M154]